MRGAGEVRGGFFGLEMVHPGGEGGEEHAPPAPLTPVYPTTSQLPQAYLRKAVAAGLARAPLQELLPPAAARRPAEPARGAAVPAPSAAGRQPLEALEDHSPGLAAPEVRRAAGAAAVAAQARTNAPRPARAACAGCGGGLTPAAAGGAPFALTAAQQRVVAEIAPTWPRPQPMHRLLQGDVGSGKTVVAALAAAGPSTPAGSAR